MNAYTGHQRTIHKIDPECNPRHIEALLRLRFGTLDILSRAEIEEEMQRAKHITQHYANGLEALADSYGLEEGRQ